MPTCRNSTQTLEEAWRRLSEEPQRLRQLTNFNWTQAAVDVSVA